MGLLQKATAIPENLGEGKLYGAQENEIHYWTGVALQGSGRYRTGGGILGKGATRASETLHAMFYNDQQPDTIFYQGLALLNWNGEEEAIRFDMLILCGRAPG